MYAQMTSQRRSVILCSVLDIVTALIALCGLLPIAGGLPAIAIPSFPFADGIWFTANLGGALLILAGGIKVLLSRVTSRRFSLFYVMSIASVGFMRLELTGFNYLLTGWLFLAAALGAILLVLQQAYWWTLVGSVWCVLFLALWSAGGITNYLSAAQPQLPVWLLFQITACFLGILVFSIHLRDRRNDFG